MALTWLCVMDFRDLDEKLHDGDFDTETCEQVDWQRSCAVIIAHFSLLSYFFAAAVIATLLDGGDVRSQLEEAFTVVSKVHDQASDALSTIAFERHTAIFNAGREIECTFISLSNAPACIVTGTILSSYFTVRCSTDEWVEWHQKCSCRGGLHIEDGRDRQKG